MNSPSHAEFAQFRFVRDRGGIVVVLPSQGSDERSLLVMDCERWGMARLHIFEGAATRKDKLEAFQDELKLISEIRSDAVSRLVTWGRDGEELFYADEMLDGEPLPEYLDRTGGVPFSIAAEWIIRLVGLLESVPVKVPSFERFSTLNLQVIMDGRNQIRPVFSEFYGWSKPGEQVREHSREYLLAQVFCSLMAGVPVRTFYSESLPRNFDELEHPVQEAVLEALADGRDGAYEKFRATMVALSENADEDRENVAFPRMAMREWLRTDLAESYAGEPEYELAETFDPGEGRYAIPAVIRGGDCLVQLLPGPDSIPREEWLSQHHTATRRVGRAMPNQLHVSYVEDRDSVTLVGEERVEGIELGNLIRTMGPQSPEIARAILQKVMETVRALEHRVGSCAVWWLPPENILALTGTRSLTGSRGLIDRKGNSFWEDVRLKLRLHQTCITLRKGVSLPAEVRQLSRVPGKKFAKVRREAVALPLLFFVLTARRFRWGQSVSEQAEMPVAIADLLERTRQQLVDDPESIETSLLEDFAVIPARLDEDSAGDSDENETDEAEEDGFEELLKSTLYQGEIDLTGETPQQEVAHASDAGEMPGKGEPVEGHEDGPDAEPEFDRVEKTSPRWKFFSSRQLWLGFWGLVAALTLGYFLAGWNTEQGVAATEAPTFPVTDFRPMEPISGEEVRARLETFFVERLQPDLVTDLRNSGDEDSQTRVGSALNALVAKGDSEAAGLRALWDLTKEIKPDSDAMKGVYEAARMGNAEAQYLLAQSVFVREEGDYEPEAVLEMLKRSAAVGNAQAQELLGTLLAERGQAGEARTAMASASRNQNVGALYQMGLFHANGTGASPNPEEAASCFQQAAGLGDERAMFAYGQCLESGFGVATSFTEARRWMKNAASLGYEPARQWCAARDVEISEESQ